MGKTSLQVSGKGLFVTRQMAEAANLHTAGRPQDRSQKNQSQHGKSVELETPRCPDVPEKDRSQETAHKDQGREMERKKRFLRNVLFYISWRCVIFFFSFLVQWFCSRQEPIQYEIVICDNLSPKLLQGVFREKS